MTIDLDKLETLSNKVRSGEPVYFLEAIAVINYQEEKRRERAANSFCGRLKRFLVSMRSVKKGEGK